MKLDEAIYEAYQAHLNVQDKSGVPYIQHPLRVMRTIFEKNQEITYYNHSQEVTAKGLLGDILIVAVLHDVWEDTKHELKNLNKEQYEAMCAITRHIGANSGETYKEYIVRCCLNPIARVVKYYDLKDNMSKQKMEALEYNEAIGLMKRYQWSIDYIKKEYG